MEREIRGCAGNACELIAGRLDIAPHTLDNWLWNRAQQAPYRERPAHHTRTLFH
jgi:hypothetical protein